jgi:hypothetical protein
MRQVHWAGLFMCGLIGVAAYCLMGGSGVGMAASAPSDDGQFSGKAVLVFCKTDRHGAALEKVAFRQVGGRTFIVGTMMDTDQSGKPNPWGKRALWVGMEDVSSLMVFDTLDEVKGVYRVWAERKEEDAKP